MTGLLKITVDRWPSCLPIQHPAAKWLHHA